MSRRFYINELTKKDVLHESLGTIHATVYQLITLATAIFKSDTSIHLKLIDMNL